MALENQQLEYHQIHLKLVYIYFYSTYNRPFVFTKDTVLFILTSGANPTEIYLCVYKPIVMLLLLSSQNILLKEKPYQFTYCQEYLVVEIS